MTKRVVVWGTGFVGKMIIPEVLAHPEWTLADAIRHLKQSMRLTSAELAKLAGLSHRTVQDIEQGRSEGPVQTMNRLLGIVGLKLGVVRRGSGDQGGG